MSFNANEQEYGVFESGDIAVTGNTAAAVNTNFAASNVKQFRLVANKGLKLVNIIEDATPANQNQFLGVAQLDPSGFAPNGGENVGVVYAGIAEIECGGTVAADDKVYGDLEGKVVNAAVTNVDGRVIGIALKAGTVGGIIPVLLTTVGTTL